MAERDENSDEDSHHKPAKSGKPAKDKPSLTLPGTVEKVIPSVHPSEPEKAQIAIEGADHLYREIRVPNILQDESGKKVTLKKGAELDVTIEADLDATTEKPPNAKPTEERKKP